MLRSAAEPLPPVVMASTSSAGPAAAAAERGDIPDCVLSELWAEHSDGVGSPLIDIFTETDCSSQVSDDEPAGGGGGGDCLPPDADDLAVLPIAVTEKLIEVVEDDDFGAVSEGGGLIWVVENDVGEADGSESCPSPPRPQSVLDLNGALNSSPQRSSVLSERGPNVWNKRLQKPSTPKRRKPSAKLNSGREPASRFRPAKSPGSLLPFGWGCDGMGAVIGGSVPVVQIEPLPLTDATVTVEPRRASAAGDGPPLQSPAATVTADTAECGGPAADSDKFSGFRPRCWTAARARWLRQLAGVAAEEREAGDASPADAALLRLQELAAAAAAARLPVPAAGTSVPHGGGSGDPPTPATRPPGSAAVPAAEQIGGGCGDTTSRAPPTYVSLMPDTEKDGFKGSFLSMFKLRHVNDPAPPAARPSRTMRQRLRKRKPVVEESEKSESAPPRQPGPGSLLAAARRAPVLPSGRRLKVLRKPGAGLLRRGFLEQRAGAGESSGDEAAVAAALERRQLRSRRRLLDFSELVEVEGVLDTANTYCGCEEPPRLLPEAAPAGDDPRGPPSGPPELPPQRWPRADAARCRVCRKFIARVLLPLHLRLHRTGYRGCDVCGQVLESAAALYRHRLAHEPPRFPCHRCGRQFDALAKLERHRASAHALLCARCSATVPTPELVHNHNCDGRREPPPPAAPPPPASPPASASPPAPASPPASASPPAPPASPPQQESQEQQQRQGQEAATSSVAAAPLDAEAMTSSGEKGGDVAKDGLVCHACGKSFLVRFNYTMHMRMVHKRGRGRAAGERGPPRPAVPASAICPDVISCLGDILSADLYNEILSVV